MKSAIRDCPRFKYCSVNICPLDNLAHLRNRLEGEAKCDIAKNIRLRIGRKYGLPKSGLTNAEYSALQKWERKTEEEKNEARTQMTKIRARKPD